MAQAGGAASPIPSFARWWNAAAARFDAVLFDVDGTLVRGERPLPGAVELLERLRSARTPHLLITNDANHSPEEKAARLRGCGLDVSPGEIVSCGHVLAPMAAGRGWGGKLFFVMGALGAPCFAEAAGMRVTRDVEALPGCEGVIVGESNYDWETVINAVVNFFAARPSAPLVCPNPDMYWPDRGGRIHIGAGGKARFVQMILEEFGARVEPLFLGKPHGPIFDIALGRMASAGLRPPEDAASLRRILVLGDSLASDIQGANARGMSSGLLLTGITGESQAAASAIRPDFTFRSLA